MTAATRTAARRARNTDIAADAPRPQQEIKDKILALLEDAKAENVVEIDLEGKSSMGDAMIIASGRAYRHVKAIAERVTDGLKLIGLHEVRVEGLPHCDWVLIDAGSFIIHVFRPEVREFYNLERLWSGDIPQEHLLS
ncbi:MAG: ribosome silencing factor [Hyphomicrobiaceae bacterium]|nr:MAG: ribosome silencing factor [Hyphomicrobiaceae bacterium]